VLMAWCWKHYVSANHMVGRMLSFSACQAEGSLRCLVVQAVHAGQMPFLSSIYSPGNWTVASEEASPTLLKPKTMDEDHNVLTCCTMKGMSRSLPCSCSCHFLSCMNSNFVTEQMLENVDWWSHRQLESVVWQDGQFVIEAYRYFTVALPPGDVPA
jgi:hypothetical protein